MTKTVLAVDASTEGCSVALCAGAQRYSQESTEARSHAQRLLPMIDAVLVEADIGLHDLDYIALVNGPGSFTGIRIALSVVQGLAYGANVPVVCVSSLAVMAQLFQHDRAESGRIPDEGLRLVTALDARMGEMYWSAYELRSALSPPVEIAAPSVATPIMFNEWLSVNLEGSAMYGAGSGFSLDGVDERLKHIDLSLAPKATGILLYLDACASDEVHALPSYAPYEIEPLYLRNEVAWKKRVRIRQPKQA